MTIVGEQIGLLQLLKRCMPDKSNNELRRLLKQNAVTINGERQNDEINKMIDLSIPLQVKVGKLGFFAIN